MSMQVGHIADIVAIGETFTYRLQTTELCISTISAGKSTHYNWYLAAANWRFLWLGSKKERFVCYQG